MKHSVLLIVLALFAIPISFVLVVFLAAVPYFFVGLVGSILRFRHRKEKNKITAASTTSSGDEIRRAS